MQIFMNICLFLSARKLGKSFQSEHASFSLNWFSITYDGKMYSIGLSKTCMIILFANDLFMNPT